MTQNTPFQPLTREGGNQRYYAHGMRAGDRNMTRKKADLTLKMLEVCFFFSVILLKCWLLWKHFSFDILVLMIEGPHT